MAKTKLTAKTVASLKPQARRVDYFDPSLPGFHLRVTDKGRKTFCVLYRVNGGKLRRYTIGTYPLLSLADARSTAREVLRAAMQGRDMALEKRQRRAAETFEDLASQFIERWAKPRKKSWKEDERILKKHLLPRLGHTKAKDVRRADVRALLEEIAESGPIMANRTLALLSKVYNWGISQDLLELNACAGLTRPGVEQRRDRVLSEAELRALWRAMEAEPVEVGGTFGLRLLSAQRGGEVRRMRWQDIEGEWWTIPAEHSKNGLPHRVPLSAPARRILERIRAERNQSTDKARRNSPYVFPNRIRPEEPTLIHHNLFEKIRKRAGLADFRGHDLRRTAASAMASMGIPRLTISKVLNHSEPHVTSVYDRHSYDDEKREALDRWATRLMRMVSELREVK